MASSSRNRLFGNFDVQLMVFLPVASLRPQLHTLLSSPSIGACPLCLVWLLKKVETVRSVLPHAASHHQHVLDIDMYILCGIYCPEHYCNLYWWLGFVLLHRTVQFHFHLRQLCLLLSKYLCNQFRIYCT